MLTAFAGALLASGVGSSAAETEYRLAVGDVLSFDLAEDDEPARDIPIGADGGIVVPYLGSVPVAGSTVSQVLARLKEGYVSRQLFVDPRISLRVANYRQVYVLGEVKTPGAYPFSSNLSVDQAVGLAGGIPTALGNVEDRILQRVKFRSDLDVAEADIAREALTYARLKAQIAGKPTVSRDDLPPSAEPFVPPDRFEELREDEENILKAESESFSSQRSHLVKALDESKNGLGVLNDLAQAQKTAITFTQSDLDRKSSLLKKGLNTASDVSVLQRQLAFDEARLLTVYAQISSNRLNAANLEKDLSVLEIDRTKNFMVEFQEQKAKVSRLISSRKSLLDQLSLVTNWTSEAAQREPIVTIAYKIRRTAESGFQEAPAIATTRLQPGDVLIVSLERDPTSSSSPASPVSSSSPASPVSSSSPASPNLLSGKNEREPEATSAVR